MLPTQLLLPGMKALPFTMVLMFLSFRERTAWEGRAVVKTERCSLWRRCSDTMAGTIIWPIHAGVLLVSMGNVFKVVIKVAVIWV